MNRLAIYHEVDSSYCYPVSEKKITLRLRCAKGDVQKAEVLYESKYVIGMSQKKAQMFRKCRTDLYDFFEVTLELEDTRLAYVFYVNDGEKSYYFSEDGISEKYDFTVGFYNFFQYPYINEADIHREVQWMRRACFYQIFIDRFCMGNKTKDSSYINCRWGDIPNPRTFAGGDLDGVTEKLDYIKSLGCNAIYLTPVFESETNHKYDISDYKHVARQFGTNETLKKLVEKAHEKGMRIVLDAVFNHCSWNMAEFKDVIEKGKDSEFYDFFVINGDRVDLENCNYETFASCIYMPKFNTSNVRVQEFLIDIGKEYIRDYDIDGWRLDVSDEISHDFWRTFRKEIKKEKSDAVIIGENWHNASNYLRGDQYDSIMNYAFTKACLDYFAKGNFTAENMADKLNSLLMRNSDTVNHMMLNLLDSHDTHRFYQETGFNRDKMKAALSLLYLFPGTPCIFYGTETLTKGGYDPDCRRCMNWSDTGEDGPFGDVFSLLTELSYIRTELKAGDGEYEIGNDGDVLVLKRILKERTISLYINITDKTCYADGFEIKQGSFLIDKGGQK